MQGQTGVGPVFFLAGGQAAGKSTMLPHLVRLARGPIVLDTDELLEDGCLLGFRGGGQEGEDLWPAYDRLWVRIVALIRRSGHPVILLCPTPSPEHFTQGQVFEPPVYWARLDCSEHERRARLSQRGWTREKVDDYLGERGHDRIRALIPIEFRTDAVDPVVLAATILDWVEKTIAAMPAQIG